MRKLLTILALGLLTASVSEAISLKDYLVIKNDTEPIAKYAIDLHIGGMGEGVFAANVAAGRKNAWLFCPPTTLALYPDNYVRILNETIDRSIDTETFRTYQDHDGLGVLLLIGLQRTFPCPEKPAKKQ